MLLRWLWRWNAAGLEVLVGEPPCGRLKETERREIRRWLEDLLAPRAGTGAEHRQATEKGMSSES
jgi:hypothetical protein